MNIRNCCKLNTLVFAVCIHIISSHCYADTFYIDSDTGDDTWTGRSMTTAWRTFARVNQHRFGPGDQILIKSGTSYTQSITLAGNGTDQRPIHLSRYGEGAKPVINGNGDTQAIQLLNSNHWTIEDLDITNPGDTKKPHFGLIVRNDIGETAKDITIRKLHIHNIDGHDERDGGAGIWVTGINTSDNKISTYDGITIEDCYIHDVPFNGIFVTSWINRNRDDTGVLKNPISNLTIRNNLLHDIAGDAISIIATRDAIIEHNEVYRSGLGQTRSAKTPSTGIGSGSSDRTIVRYNRVEGLRGMLNGQAYDVDINCKDVLMENNLSRNNGTGFVLVCNDSKTRPLVIQTQNTIIRNNMSLDDAAEIHGFLVSTVGWVKGVTFENNVFSITRKGDRRLFIGGNWLNNDFPQGITFRRNIFVTQTTSVSWVQGTKEFALEGNLWQGNFTGLPKDPKGLVGDPKFLKTPIFDSLDASIAQDSPALQLGFKPFDLKKAGLTSRSSWLKERDNTAKQGPAGP